MQRLALLLLFLLINSTLLFAQTFSLPEGKKNITIKFKLVNNLMVIPVSVNGKELSFILDTGASDNLLFSVEEIDSLQVKNVTPIKIRGLGSDGLIDALKSEGNFLNIGSISGIDQKLYIVFDETTNFSPKMGIPIHGVIGYDLFKDFVVIINYPKRSLKIIDPKYYKQKICKKCQSFPLKLKNNRPYVEASVMYFNKKQNVELLLDSGSSDALWLFNEAWGINPKTNNYFIDFLGTGVSGAIFGKKSKIDAFILSPFQFKNIKVSYPDSLSLSSLYSIKDRDGNIGAEVLSRFHIVLNYPNEEIILRKNAKYKAPFYYNMAGIIVEHDGLVNVKMETGKKPSGSNGMIEIAINTRFNILLAPKYIITQVREGSPAHRAGLKKGDEIVSINNKKVYEFELFEIMDMFFEQEGKRINMQIIREGKNYNHKFYLERVL